MSNIEPSAEQFAVLAGKHHDDVVAHYLGRGMKGTTCLAYTGERPDLFALDLARVLVEPGLSGAIFHGDAFDTLRSQMDALGDPTTDVWGRGTVHSWRDIVVDNHTQTRSAQ